jgi:hypothetical protein
VVVANQSTLSIDNQTLISRKGHKEKTQRIAKLSLIIIYDFAVFVKDIMVLQEILYKIMIMRYLRLLFLRYFNTD